MLRRFGIVAAWVVALAVWLTLIYAVGEFMGHLDGRPDCDRPVDCEVSPQDAWQQH